MPRSWPSSAAERQLSADGGQRASLNANRGGDDEENDDDPLFSTQRSAEAVAARMPALRGDDTMMHSKLQYMYVDQRLPGSFLGPVELSPVDGSGWGLVATGVIDPGEPILICAPLALVAGPPGRAPPPSALLEVVRAARWLAPSRRLLESLTDGATPRPSDAAAAAKRREADAKLRRGKSAYQRRQEREVLSVLQQLGVELDEDALAVGEGGAEQRELAALEAERRGGKGSSGGSGSGGGGGDGPPLVRNLLAGLSDMREEGQLGSRPPIRMDPERCVCRRIKSPCSFKSGVLLKSACDTPTEPPNCNQHNHNQPPAPPQARPHRPGQRLW
jgi:hypothetical protein